jgi:hypothetical protein
VASPLRESPRAGVVPCWAGVITAGLVSLLFLWPFRLYGFDPLDEGTQLAQIARVVAGERPYVDFETGYTPGYFAFASELLKAGDGSLVVLRTFGVLWQAVLAGLLWGLIRRWSGPGGATGATAVYVAFFLPVSLGGGAPFNVPYPGWWTAGIALAAQALVAETASGGRWRISLFVMVGALAGAAFSLKPNVGLLVFAASLLAALPGWSQEDFTDRALAQLVRVSAVVGSGVMVWAGASGTYGLALLLPYLAAVWAATPQGQGGGRAALDDVALVVGFMGVVLPWLLPLSSVLGVGGVLRDVLLLDGGVVDAYLIDFPWPEPATWVVAFGLAATRIGQVARRMHWAGWIAFGLVVVLVGFQGGARLAVENLLLWAGPMVLIDMLVGRASTWPGPRERAAALFFAVLSWQLFPRADLIHVSMGALSLLLVAGPWASARLREGVMTTQSQASIRWMGPGVLGLVLFLSLLRIVPALGPRLTEEIERLDLGPNAPVGLVRSRAQSLAWLEDLRSEVESRALPGQAIFTFPDVASLGFLTGRPQPFHHLYFVPGRPDEKGEARTIARLGAVEPALVVECPPHAPAFAEAPSYFQALGEAIDRAYAPVATAGGCRLRVPRRR